MKDSSSLNFANMSFKKWNNLFTFTGLPYCCFQHLVSKRILKFEEWWFVGLKAVLSCNQVFFWFNEAVVETCFDGLQVWSFLGSQIAAMTIAQQEKFNYTIFSLPGRHDISPSLTVLSHWGYNQATLSWPLRVHSGKQMHHHPDQSASTTQVNESCTCPSSY